MKQILILLACVLINASLVFGGIIKGVVKDSKTAEPLIGANIVLEGTSIGTSSDLDGAFVLDKVADGIYTLSIYYVGYERYSQKGVTPGSNLEIEMQPMIYNGSEITVLADRATRETPVAYSNVSKKDMEVRLGSQDIPMALNTTPSVYATMQGGGAGDARINVRGFDQKNVAVMINGVPVNDMENGWVYWSNWDGVGDATSEIQVQRGLSAVNLSIPSIGGTMNIITDPAAQNQGVKYKQEYGNDGFLKSTLVANTGLINGKYAFNGSLVRKIGNGYVDGSWTDAWAYYFGASYTLNKNNRFELYALGAPQRHGQNLYKQNIGAYSHSFARDLDDYDVAALEKFKERGRRYNENWNTTNYIGAEAWNGKLYSMHEPGFLNERENYFHKPQINLNWYTNLTSQLNVLSSNILFRW